MGEQFTFKRYEIKYMIPKRALSELKQDMSEHMRADEHGRSTILSLYYDTPDFRLIRKSLEHPVYKEKLRVRSYGPAKEDSQIFIELKKKYEGIVYKRRMEMSKTEADRYLSTGVSPKETQIAREIDYFFDYYGDLRPAVLLSYEREAFYDKNNREFRVTFDDNILYRDYNLTLDSGIYGSPVLPYGKVLMEVKTGEAMPMWFVKLLTKYELKQTSFSKYATAYRNILSERINGGERYA